MKKLAIALALLALTASTADALSPREIAANKAKASRTASVDKRPNPNAVTNPTPVTQPANGAGYGEAGGATVNTAPETQQ